MERMLRNVCVTFCVLATALSAPTAWAHPVPRDQYDRIVVVRLKDAQQKGMLQVEIDFRLEVDPQTIVLNDMAPYRKEVDLSKIVRRIDYFEEFTRIYESIYGRNFFARFNNAKVTWKCIQRTQTFEDEEGKPLDHLRCDFRYRATVTPLKDEDNRLLIRDLNYQDYPGKIQLSIRNESSFKLTKTVAPDPKMQELPFDKRGPDEENALRMVEVVFPGPLVASLKTKDKTAAPPSTSPVTPRDTETETPAKSTPPASHLSDPDTRFSLLRLFLDTRYGLFLMMVIAVGFGAIHALTPGHGKTMVAAYLVGERGTMWHAVFLGLVTTITHTGAVLVLAAVLAALPAQTSQGMKSSIQAGLGLAMGLAITCLGLFLLLQRLAGRADHFHIGGDHHHHHGPGHHHHEHTAAAGEKGGVKWWGLVTLGVTGGLIPCWDAIALLVMSISTNEFWLAFPVLLAFSAGLAGVLVLIGVLVVRFRHVLGNKWGEGRLVRTLPIISAILVTLMGFWICYEAVHTPGL